MGRADQAPAFRELGFTMFSCTFESNVLATASASAAAALSNFGWVGPRLGNRPCGLPSAGFVGV